MNQPPVKPVSLDDLDWYPMIEAPKDGTFILARGYDYDHPTGRSHYGVVRWDRGAWRNGDTIYLFINGWRPLSVFGKGNYGEPWSELAVGVEYPKGIRMPVRDYLRARACMNLLAGLDLDEVAATLGVKATT